MWLVLVVALALATPAWGGQLDASWTAPTTNTDGSALADLASYRLYWFLFPNTPCPGTQFLVVPSPTTTPPPNTTVTKNLPGLTQGFTYNVQVTAVDTAGNESPCSTVASAPARADTVASSVKFGEPNLVPDGDFGDGNFLLAQQATLAVPGTLTTLSFNVTTPAGQLRLGLYSDASGVPNVKLAETAAFTPVAGWNTIAVTVPVPLQPGSYWLAFLPSSSSLAFPVDRTSGAHRYVAFTFAAMPATWPTGSTAATAHWSLFGTVTTTPGLPIPGSGLKLQFRP